MSHACLTRSVACRAHSQAVATLQCLRDMHGVADPFLIVAPLSTLTHWQRELASWSSLHAVVFHGNKEARDVLVEREWRRGGSLAKPRFDALVTSYEMLVVSAELFRKVRRWGYVVLDEAHRLKNKEAKALTALKSLACPRKLALTGTPLQNNVGELWSMLNMLDAERFASLDEFMSQFGDMTEATQVQGLTELLRPYLLRRVKADVDLGLAPMEETLVTVEITNFQKRCYRAVLEQNRALLLRGVDVAGAGPSFNNISMQLRHCCNHPFLIKGVVEAEGLSSAPDAVWLDRMVASSGKLVLLDKLLPRLRSDGHRVLLFSQFTMLLDLLEDYIIQN